MAKYQIEISENFDGSLLTNITKDKINTLFINYYKNENINGLNALLDKMISAFQKNIDVDLSEQIDTKSLQKIFIDFDKYLNNITDSKFQSDITKMNRSLTVNLHVGYDTIKINFLYDDFKKNINYIAVAIHALNTFCNYFKYNYNGLTLNISLDNNTRINILPKNYDNYDNIFKNLKQKSAAFSVAGVTYRNNKNILLTKKEEFIKLMFHEMIHYIGLDEEIIETINNYNLAINKNNLNLSEAYTELISLILNSAYETIHIYGLNKKINKYECFINILAIELNYSLYLTSNVLKFYGYDIRTYMNFFDGIGEKKYCPIYIWEYFLIWIVYW
jgi:hypothetical protein